MSDSTDLAPLNSIAQSLEKLADQPGESFFRKALPLLVGFVLGVVGTQASKFLDNQKAETLTENLLIEEIDVRWTNEIDVGLDGLFETYEKSGSVDALIKLHTRMRGLTVVENDLWIFSMIGADINRYKYLDDDVLLKVVEVNRKFIDMIAVVNNRKEWWTGLTEEYDPVSLKENLVSGGLRDTANDYVDNLIRIKTEINRAMLELQNLL